MSQYRRRSRLEQRAITLSLSHQIRTFAHKNGIIKTNTTHQQQPRCEYVSVSDSLSLSLSHSGDVPLIWVQYRRDQRYRSGDAPIRFADMVPAASPAARPANADGSMIVRYSHCSHFICMQICVFGPHQKHMAYNI